MKKKEWRKIGKIGEGKNIRKKDERKIKSGKDDKKNENEVI